MLRFNFGQARAKRISPASKYRPSGQQYRLVCELFEDRLLLAGQAAWTVMVYVTADDKLASGLNGNIKQLEAALAQFNTTSGAGSVQIAVLYDQSQSKPANLFATPVATPTGILPAQTWSNTGEAILQPNASDPDSRGITTPFTLLGPKDSSQPALLNQFITWAATNAPAQHYALVFEDHGAGWRGFNDSGDGSLKTPGIANVLNSLATSVTPTKFDLIGFDECLMADAQAEDPLAGSASVLVGSEELEEGTGWNFTTTLNALNVANPATVTASQLGTSIVNGFAAQYTTGPVNGAKKSDTLSAVQTSALANLDSALNAFTNVALGSSTTASDWNAMAFARNQAPWYSETQAEGYVDLGTFMNAVAAAPGVSAALKTAATNVSTSLASAIIAKAADSRQSSGLSVYMPPPGTAIDSNYFNPASTDSPGLAALFVKNTNWFDFLVAFKKNAPAQAAAPASFVDSGPSRSAANAFDLHDQIGPDNSYAGLSLPLGDGSSDQEWFSFTLAATGISGNAVTATYAPGGGTVDLTLFDQNSTQLGESNTGNGLESISLAGLPAGTYFVMTQSGNDESGPFYTLAVNAPMPATIPADYAGNNHSQATAFELGSITSVAEFSGLTLQTGETDWYRFELTTSPTPLDVGASSLTVQGSNGQVLTVQITDQAGNVLASGSGAGTVNVTYPQLDSGAYFLTISGAAGGYALHFNPPLLTNGDLDLDPTPVGPGQPLTLHGSVEELATPQTYTVQINWGDGSPQSTVNLGADSYDFQAIHTYAKVGTYSITATVTGVSGISGSGAIISEIEPAIINPDKDLLSAALAFLNSAENLSLFVAQEFQLILHRNAETAANSYWTAQMQAGLSQEGLTADLLSSQEFITKSGGGAAWIQQIYQTLFDRPGDSIGLNYWEGRLQNGLSPAGLAQAFTGSTEWLDRNISGLYTELLGRPADPAGLSHWEAIAGATGRIESVAVGILASSEYYSGPEGGAGSPADWIDAVYESLFQRQASASETTFWLGQI